MASKHRHRSAAINMTSQHLITSIYFSIPVTDYRLQYAPESPMSRSYLYYPLSDAPPGVGETLTLMRKSYACEDGAIVEELKSARRKQSLQVR